jgi:hypothetical protein
MSESKPSLLNTFLSLKSESLLCKYISSEKLEKQLLYLCCEYIEKTLHRYNEVRPKDHTPQYLINKTRMYLNDEITFEELSEYCKRIHDIPFECATPQRAARFVLKAILLMLLDKDIFKNFEFVVSYCRNAIYDVNKKFPPYKDEVYFEEETTKYTEWQEKRFVDMLEGIYN